MDETIELEDHFILRLPEKQSNYCRKYLKNSKSARKLGKRLFIRLDPECGEGSVTIRRHQMPAVLKMLPTITESYKTCDGVNLFKTANICQMLDCCDSSALNNNADAPKSKRYPHGLAPPLKNVTRRRFRRHPTNRDELIEKELAHLLREDSEAVSTRFELIYDPVETHILNEKSLFGSSSSDNSDNTDMENYE